MNKDEVYSYIKSRNIWHIVKEHPAVFTMEELTKIDIPYFECSSKNLFVRDDKKRNFYLITIKGDKKVNLKDFKNKNGLRTLSFASENDLKEILDLTPGSVTSLGLLNDKKHKVIWYLDKDFFEDEHIIGVHLNINTASIWLKVEDLVEIIKEHGNQINIVEMD